MTELQLAEAIKIAAEMDGIADEMFLLTRDERARAVELHRQVLRLRRIIALQPVPSNNP